ncbi:hypothetical protein BC793_11547 [Actinoplanes xinjiangensis]|jgi:hypothetical protein|uniref:Uncharacterized protein n=2 Tax=Actinoplanes xinjiangensis TaxID=512350 RepID=A0A316F897_9ACTN|nr:hypothetical protein BC793_11547 [Actinoplanes xinjiangensis]
MLGRRLLAVLSALVLMVMILLSPSVRAEPAEPRRPERAGWTAGAPDPDELPGGGLSPMLLAAIGGYLLTGGLALLLLRR